MIKKLLIFLIALVLLTVPAVAEEINWSYTITSSLQTVTEGLPFGCNLVTTDYIDIGYDLPAPPNAMGQTGYAVYQIYESEGVFSEGKFVQSLNSPLTSDNDESVFFLKLCPDIEDPATPFSIAWDPVADANLPDTITSITLVNLSDTRETYNLLEAGSATGTGYKKPQPNIIVPISRTYSITVTYKVLPVASFTTDVTTGVAPLTVQFTDTSTCSPTRWSWTFGDGATSPVQNPTHKYTSPGNYTVTLSVEGGKNICTKPELIKITPVLFGDANNNNEVNQADTLHVLKEVVGIIDKPLKNTEIFEKTDVSRNGVIDVGDAMFIAQYNVGLRGPWFELL